MANVTWGSVRAVAQEIDKAYKQGLPSGRKGPACTAKPVTSNLQPGIPELMEDDTSPFKIPFPISKTLYQRFEFAYFENRYQQYKQGDARPVYHSEYLTGSLSSNATSYITPAALGLGVSAAHVCNLIESKRDKMWKWWGESCEYYAKSPTIAAELYFVTGKGSVCPCPGVYRVAYAVSGGKNGNGNGAGGGGPHFPPSGAVHHWSLKSATTLEQIDFSNLRPEDGADSTYAEPPTGCCARMVFPKFGAEGGGDGITMYDVNLFYPNYQNAITKPFTPLVGDMSVEIYAERKAAGTLPAHVAANNATMYDSVSKHESWKVCKEGGTVGVRITPLKFEWGTNTNRRVSIVWCPTSVTVALSGAFQPAIRKRWYDMMYYKLHHTVGGFGPNAEYATGTTWKVSGEGALGSYDVPCSRYLAQGFGWAKHEKAQAVEAAYNGEKFMEQFICVKNYSGNIKCDGKGGGAYNADLGCYCSEESGKRDDCRDLACNKTIPVPWMGGCANKSCAGFNTHQYSIATLKAMANFTQTHKESEPIGGITMTVAWDSCAVKYKKGDSHSLTFKIPIGGGSYWDKTFPTYSFSYGAIEYYEYSYEDTQCSGCKGVEDDECPIYVTGEGGGGAGGSIKITPKQDVPICVGMGYVTILKPDTKKTITLKFKGSMAGLLMPGQTYKIVGDKEKPCKKKDDKEDPQHPTIMQAEDGGVITIKAFYGPIGSSKMRGADKSVEFIRKTEEDTDLDDDIILKFDEDTSGQYRCNIVVYVEVWIAGKGENNPFTLITTKGGCFTPKPTSVSISVQ